MKRSEAQAVLDDHKYQPGRDGTARLPRDVRRLIKLALNAIKGDDIRRGRLIRLAMRAVIPAVIKTATKATKAKAKAKEATKP